MEGKVKRTRRSRIQKSLSNVDGLVSTRYLRNEIYKRLEGTNCDKEIAIEFARKKMTNFEGIVTEMARNVQKSVPEVINDPVVASMDAFAKLATERDGKKVSNFELPIVLKGLHEIYPLPEMQDQTPLDVRALYQFLHHLSMGQPAVALGESSILVLREAFNELMEEVNSAASTERIKQLEEVLKNPQQLSVGANADMQHLLHNELNLADPSINLFQIPPEMLFEVKDK